jgi:hypothetical protein
MPKTIYYKLLEPELGKNVLECKEVHFRPELPVYFLFGCVTLSHVGLMDYGCLLP